MMEIWLLSTALIPNFSVLPSHRRGTGVCLETYLSFLHFKMLLEDFTHHNIDMACNLLEVCGRFLYRSPESHVRTRNLLVCCSVLFNTSLWRSFGGRQIQRVLPSLTRKRCAYHMTRETTNLSTFIQDNWQPNTFLCERKPVVRQFNRKRIPKLLKGWSRLCSW